jgi:NAD(P)-dependent dehydrogenase (short-subunit alcohol dehydrogenase family)
MAVPTERNIQGANFVCFGGSTGIGHATAMELGRRGAAVLIIGRSVTAGEAAITRIRAAGAASADFLAGDLASVAGIEAVAAAVRAWRPALHGMLHTAMSAFNRKLVTTDGFELGFALQYFARAALNRMLAERLAASGDGRIVHIAGDVPGFVKPDLDDLQFARRKWGFYKAILGTHVLGFLHIQEAAKRWHGMPITICASCVGPTRTKAMADPVMPLSMRLMGLFATQPEVSAVNAVKILTGASTGNANGSIFRKPKQYRAEPLSLDPASAARLWDLTAAAAASRGLQLPQ